MENLLEDAKENILPSTDELDESDGLPSATDSTGEKSPSHSKPAANAAEKEPTTTDGRFADGIHLPRLDAMRLVAMAVLLCWARLKRSFQILLAGFAFAIAGS